MKIDASRFKKVSSDKNCTVLKDPDGHEFRVMHAALKPEMKKLINQMPQHFEEGGEVADPVDEGWQTKLNNWVNRTNAGANDASSGITSAVDTYGQNMRDSITSVSAAPEAAQTASMPSPAPAEQPLAEAAPVPEAAMPMEGGQGLAPLDPASPAMPQQAMPATPGADIGMGALGKFQKGQQLEAQALDDYGKAQADIAQGEVDTLQKLDQDYQAKNADLTSKRDAAVQEFNSGKINPNQYYDSMTTGQRVRNVIGLMLSGFGAGLAGQENMAAKLIDKEIERDIDAQKANLGKKQNLVSYYNQELGNLKDATMMARATQQSLVAAKLKQAAALAQGPVAKARALKEAAEFEMKSAGTIQKAAAQQTAMGILKSASNVEKEFPAKLNALRTLNPDAAKDLEEKWIPGVGVASIKPTDKDRETLTATNSIMNQITALQARAIKNGTTLPGTEADRVNKNMMKTLQLDMKNAFMLGALSNSDYEALNQIVADPGSFFTSRSVAQLDATKKNMAQRHAATMSKLGIQPFASGRVKVSNGKQTYEIDPADLTSAQKDGFKQVR